MDERVERQLDHDVLEVADEQSGERAGHRREEHDLA